MTAVSSTEDSVTSRRWARRLSIVAILVLCGLLLWIRFSHIGGTLPYPYHVDEGAVIGPAQSMLSTGNLHPGTFNYPSFPKYLASLGLAGGFLRSARDGETRDVTRLGSVGYPYYTTPGAVAGAKQLFALLSVIALGVTGAMAWSLAPNAATVWVAPLVLMGSSLFFRHSWVYLNVDIVGTCFAVLAVASALSATANPSGARSAVIPGICAGLAAASKYTLGLVLIPVVLGIWLHQRSDRRLMSSVVAVGTSLLAFVAVVPYSVIDYPAFLNGLAFEAQHYRSGHLGFNAAPGLAQLAYYGRHFLHEFGTVGGVLAVLGLSSILHRDWRKALMLAAFPVALLALLAAQRVHFPRNVLAIHPFYALLIGFGLVGLCRAGAQYVERQKAWRVGYRRVATAALCGALVLGTLPAQRYLAQARVPVDSRNLAERWIADEVPEDWTVLMPIALGFDTRALKDRGVQVLEVEVTSPQQQLDMLSHLRGEAVALLPSWGLDGRFESSVDLDAMNRAGSTLRVIREFGDTPVLLNYLQPTAWGNPRFQVVTR